MIKTNMGRILGVIVGVLLIIGIIMLPTPKTTTPTVLETEQNKNTTLAINNLVCQQIELNAISEFDLYGNMSYEEGIKASKMFLGHCLHMLEGADWK